MAELPDDPTGLTISEAAKVWSVSRDTVRRWVREGAVEAHQDQAKVWRIARGQEPPPSVANWRAQRPSLGHPPGIPQVMPDVAPTEDPTAHLRDDLGKAQQENARLQAQVGRLEAQLEGTRETLNEVRSERDHLREALRQALDRPSLVERLWKALRRSPAADPGVYPTKPPNA